MIDMKVSRGLSRTGKDYLTKIIFYMERPANPAMDHRCRSKIVGLSCSA